MIPNRQSCWGFQSAHKCFGSFSKLPTSVQQRLPILPAHETAFSEVTTQIRFFNKQRSVFCPLCNTPPSVFFLLSPFIINTYIRTCPSLGKGSFCLAVSGCCQTAKTQNKPSQRRQPGPSLAAAILVLANPALSLTTNLLPITTNPPDAQMLLSYRKVSMQRSEVAKQVTTCT